MPALHRIQKVDFLALKQMPEQGTEQSREEGVRLIFSWLFGADSGCVDDYWKLKHGGHPHLQSAHD